MHANFLDRYSRLDSVIHRLRPGEKLVMALAIVVLATALPFSWWMVLIAIAVLLLAVSVLSRIPWRFLVRRMLWLEPFVMGVAVLALFEAGGWRAFVLLSAKCSLCLWTMILLANTTPFSDLLLILRRARVPGLMLTTLALMYRYLFVLIDETQRMRRARASRTFSRRRWWTWRTSATVIGQLFIRSSERAERIYAAMCARGWK
jgi:cobalt/nickel transport system permease protein